MGQATDYLRTIASSRLSGIKTTTEVVFGFPAQYILTAAETQGVDLIVMCSHGRTGFARWALGSVAHILAHESTVPTLILRECESASLLSSTESMRPLCALVPLDGSELSEAALIPATRLVTALAAPAQGALHMVQVAMSVPAEEEGFVSEINEETLLRIRTYLEQVAEGLQTTMKKDSKLSITSSVELEKDVSSALVHLAEHGERGTRGIGSCDLIVISTHGRGGLERWVMGSVTDRILTNTKLPMLIVRAVTKKE